MSLLTGSEDWYRDYLAGPDFNAYYDDTGKVLLLSAECIADMMLKPLLKQYRFEPDSKIWYKFTGLIWKRDRSMHDIIRITLKEVRLRAKQAPEIITGSTKLNGSKFSFEVQHILEAMTAFHKSLDEFDKNPYLLNTPNGTYNLLTGEHYSNKAEDFCRQITNISPLDDEDGKKCPNYLAHLRYITENKEDIVNCVEQISGYLLTGITSLQEFYWFSGITQSGKSQLTIAWREIMGGIGDTSYFVSAPNDMFAKKYNEPHTQIWLRLAGKRFILIEEPKDSKWDDHKLKEFTSGNPITAAAKGKDNVCFLPVGKIVFLTNEQPSADVTDAAIIRRLNIFDFTKQITEDMKIIDFGEKVLFKQEGPYILNRMIKASKQVLTTEKIIKPRSIQDNKKDYVQSNNLVQLFMQDACVTGENYSEPRKIVHTAFIIWCNENGYDPMSLNDLGTLLRKMHYKAGRVDGSRVILGLALNDLYRKKTQTLPSYSNSLNN